MNCSTWTQSLNVGMHSCHQLGLSAAHQRARHCVHAGVTASSTMTSTHPNDLSLDTNETADDLGSERLPPLRELIWRRLRRRSAQMARLEDDNEGMRRVDSGGTGSIPTATNGQMPVRTHREGLTRMVDQMRIDQATNTGNATSGNPTTGNNGGGGEGSNPSSGNVRNIQSGISSMGSFSLYQHDPYNHASFRAQYVNRIRPDEPPQASRSMNFSR